MIKTLFFALCLVSAALPAAAQSGPGTTSSNFLKMGAGARQIAMGEAVSGLADDVNTAFYNPAGLGMLRRQQVALMYNSYIEGVTQQNGAYALPSRSFGTLGFAFNSMKVKAFDSFDVLDQNIGSVGASDLAASVSYAREIGSLRRVSVGASLRYVQSKLGSYTSNATMLDLGLIAKYGLEGRYETRYRLGGYVKNLGPDQKFISEAYKLPQSLHVGGSREAPMPHPFEDMRVIMALESVVPIDLTPYLAVGVELRIVREFALRIGYRGANDAGLGVAVGFGFTSLHRGFVPKWVPEVSMDYALVDYGALAQAHRIGFSMKFGADKLEAEEYESTFESIIE